MMKHQAILFAALFAAAPLLAQEEKKQPPAGAQAMPNPKTKEHDALKAFVGNWETSYKSNAMPGVPGMEKATEGKGSEQVELICNGLYLKAICRGTWQGEPMEGLWITGYDPFQKRYTMVAAGSSEPETCTGTATYDEKKNTWDFRMDTAQGPARAVLVFNDPDNSVETITMTGADGKEVTAMEITRKRSRSAPAVDAAATAAKPPPKEHEELHKMIGEWDATVRHQAEPGGPFREEKGTERVNAVCRGNWVWSDFRGQMMGTPFEGHWLGGYDPKQKQYVSFWLDSMSAVPLQSKGTYDASTKTWTLEGKGVDHEGKPITTKEIGTWVDDNSHKLDFECRGEKGTTKMQITYKRRGAAPPPTGR